MNYSISIQYKRHLNEEKSKIEEMKNVEYQQNMNYQYPNDNNNGINNRNFIPFNPMLTMCNPLQMRNNLLIII